MSEENTEFAALFSASGWNQREAAEKLFTTTATISRYLANLIVVPRSTVELFKLVLAGENPAALQPAGARPTAQRNEAGELNSQLIELRRTDPKAYATVKTMIGSIHAQATAKAAPQAPVKPALTVELSRKDKAKLTPEQQARVLEAASAGAVVAARLAQKPKAASTAGKKVVPMLPARQDSDDPQSPPAQVPAKRASG